MMRGINVLNIFIAFLMCIGFVSANVVINEILPNVGSIDWDQSGTVSESADEWVELYNNGTASIDISGWNISDKDQVRYTFPTSTIIDAKSYIVVFDLSLFNSQDNVTLYDNSSNAVDRHSWSSDPGNDVSIGRIHDGLPSFVTFESPTINITNNIRPTGSLSNQTIVQGILRSFNISKNITDADGDSLVYSVVGENESQVNCSVVGNDNITFIGSTSWTGIANCVIQINDSYSLTNKTFYIKVTPSNYAPNISSTLTNINFDEDSYSLTNLSDYVVDEDLDENITWSSSSASNLIIKINQTTKILNVSADSNWNGQRNITLTATDLGGLSASKNITVIVNPVNDAPYFTSTAGTSATENIEYSYDANANDIDSDVSLLQFSIVDAPSNAAINSSNGIFRWTPSASQIGLNPMKIRVSDLEGGYTDQQFNVTVLPALEIVNMKINGVSVQNNATVSGLAPGSIVNVSFDVKNNWPNTLNKAIVDINVEGLINGNIIADVAAFTLEGQEIKHITDSYQIPFDITYPTFDFNVTASGKDLYTNNHNSGYKANHLVIDRDFHRVQITNKIWSNNNLTCLRDTTLDITVTNTGNWSENGSVTVYNQKTNTNQTQDFSLGLAEDVVLSFIVDASAATTNENFIITVKYYYGYYTLSDSSLLNIKQCLNTTALNSILKVNQTQAPAWSPINLKNYTFGNLSGVNYAIAAENATLIDCNVTLDGIFSCGTASDMFGVSLINMSVGDVYQQFNVNVLRLNKEPVAYNMSASLNEDNSTVVYFNCSDADNDSLSYTIVSNPLNGSLSGSGNSRTYTPNLNYYGPDSFVYRCNDGYANSNNATVNLTIKPVLDEPSIVGFSPVSNPRIGDGVMQQFSINISDPDAANPTINWYVDGNLEQTGINKSFKRAASSNYTVKVNITNATTNKEHVWNVVVSKVPLTGFSGTINNVNESNVEAFRGLTIYNSNAKIDFGDQPINLSEAIDIDSNVRLSNGAAGINSDAAGFEVFKNKPAKITMYGISSEKTPKIFYNSGFSISGSNECTNATNPSCTNITYSGSTLTFFVSHFTMFWMQADNTPEGTGALDISVDVSEDEPKPDEKVTIDVDVENNGDLDIEDIDLIIELRDESGNVVEDLDGDEMEDDDNFDLDSDDETTSTFTFTMPLDAEDGDEYTVYVKACGDDEKDQEECDIDDSETIKIQKEKHEVLIDSATISPSSINCFNSADISIDLKNIGSKDEDVVVSVYNNDLGLNDRQTVEIEAEDEDTYQKTVNFAINAPSDLEEGTYNINVKAEYSGKTAAKTITLTKGACLEQTEEDEEEVLDDNVFVVTLDKNTVVTQDPADKVKPATAANFKDSFEYIVLLAILGIVALGLIVFLIGAIIINR
jgi:hypothetical protein